MVQYKKFKPFLAANPLRGKLSENLYFHGEFVFSIEELLVFIGENLQFTMVFFSNIYLTVKGTFKLFIIHWGVK